MIYGKFFFTLNVALLNCVCCSDSTENSMAYPNLSRSTPSPLLLQVLLKNKNKCVLFHGQHIYNDKAYHSEVVDTGMEILRTPTGADANHKDSASSTSSR